MSNLNFNKAIISGRLTDDVQLKTTQSGTFVCAFTIAVNRKTKEKEQKTDFINCVAWRISAEFISKWFKKGSAIMVVGSIQTRSWTDNNGNKRYTTEVIVDEVHFVDSKGENGEKGGSAYIPQFDNSQFDDSAFEDLSGEEVLPF